MAVVSFPQNPNRGARQPQKKVDPGTRIEFWASYLDNRKWQAKPDRPEPKIFAKGLRRGELARRSDSAERSASFKPQEIVLHAPRVGM
jgi:hypothetical protein